MIAILLPDLRGGGAERVCVNLANEFVERGLQVSMLVMRNQGELRQILDSRVCLVDLRASRPRYLLLPLCRYLKRECPAALLANMWPLTILAVLARILSRTHCRLVTVEHTAWSVARLTQRWRTRITIKTTMRWLLPKANAIVAVSKGAASDLEGFAGFHEGQVQALYNPVIKNRKNITPMLPQLAKLWLQGGGHKRVLAVGTLKRVKDFSILLRAFALVREKIDARLLILGEGDERPRLEDLIGDLCLKQFVDMPGFVIDVIPYYRAADLFALSSSNEGLPTVLIEALAQGTPVVSTDCPSGPREILEDGKYGTLVPVGDVEALANAMQDALCREHDPEMLMRRAQDFSVDKAADAYLDLLLPGWRDKTR